MAIKKISIASAADSDGGFGRNDYSFVFSSDIRVWSTTRLRNHRNKQKPKPDVVKGMLKYLRTNH